MKNIFRNQVSFLASSNQITRMRQAVMEHDCETMSRVVLLAEGGRMSWEHAGIEASLALAKELASTRRALRNVEKALLRAHQ